MDCKTIYAFNDIFQEKRVVKIFGYFLQCGHLLKGIIKKLKKGINAC